MAPTDLFWYAQKRVLWEAFLRTSRTQRHYSTIYLRYSWSSTNLESCGMLVVFRLLDWPVLRNPGGNPRGILKILLIFWKSKSPLSSEWNLCDIGPVVVELEQFKVSQGPIFLNQGVPNVNVRAENRFSRLICSVDFWRFWHSRVVYSRSWTNFELSDILDVSSRLVQLSRENPRGISKSE